MNSNDWREQLVLTAFAALVGLLAALCLLSLGGCRTGIRRTANAIQGQGVSTIDYEESADKTAFGYLTSENSAADLKGLRVVFDPKTGGYEVIVDRASIVRSPSENQQFFAQQLAEGRTADTDALAAYGSIAGAIVEGAVNAAINAALPAYVSRQDNKTQRRQISADRDVRMAELEAMHGGEEGGHGEGEAPTEAR